MTLLGDLIVDDSPGFACSKSKLTDDGLIHFRPFNIGADGRLDFEQVYRIPEREAPTNKRALQAGDLLFNNTNSVELVGKVALIERDISAGFSNHLTRLRVDSSRVEPAYVLYFLRFLWQSGIFAARATRWVSQAAFKSEQLRAISFPHRPLAEQSHIVDILSRAEGIIRLQRQAAEKAREIIPVLFLDMFGDPVTNPKGWTTNTFGSVGTLDRGKSRNRPRDAKELYGGPYPFIQTGDIANSGGRITGYNSTYSELGLAQSKLWPKGTLCITIAANIARTAVLEFDACFPDSVVGFLPRDGIKTEYVQAWLSFLQPTLETIAPQAAQKNINLEILRNLPIPVPPLGFQQMFTDRVSEICGILTRRDVSQHSGDSLFQALLARAFNA